MVTFLHLLHKVKHSWGMGLWMVLFILLFAGGLGLYIQEFRILAVVVQVFFLLITILSRPKVLVPKGFVLFFLFLLFLGLNITWSKAKIATLDYLILFAGGGAIWLLFYNYSKKLEKGFEFLLIFLGVAFAASYLANLISLGQVPVRSWTLYLPGTFSRNHNHLGDLWALVLVVLGHRLLTRPRWWQWALLSMGVYFLAISLSRSAYLALGVGVFYLFNKLSVSKNYKKLLILFTILVTGLFLYAGVFKSTLFARPYFGQVLYGLKKWPIGVGVGNFELISGDPQSPWWSSPGLGKLSSSAHNLVLEMFAGMGVFGFIFTVFFAYVLADVLKFSRKTLFTALFIAISVNFMFDPTYYIPTMVWLWFATLGLSQNGKKGYAVKK